MAMTVRTNPASLVAQRYLSNNGGQLQDSVEKLASGYRVNSAKDDAPGLAISETMRAQVRSLNQTKRNANDAVGMFQVAEGAMQVMSNILIRMREITLQAATDTLGEKERTYLNREYMQLGGEIERIKKTTEFNGRSFFTEGSSDLTEYTIQVGTKHSTEGGDSNPNTVTFDLSGLQFSSDDLGMAGGSAIGAKIEGDTGPSREDITEKLEGIDRILAKLSGERSTLGALQGRFTSTIASIDVSAENMELAMSRIRDIDFAAETARYTQSRILSEAGTSILSQANALPELALGLLANL